VVFSVQVAFSAAMLFLVTLFYLSNPKNDINRWFSVSGLFFSTGVIKEALLFDVIPWLSEAFGLPGLEAGFAPVHAVMTWMVYTLSTPTLAVAGIYFACIDKEQPKRVPYYISAVFVPGFVLSFIFPPLHFIEFQLSSKLFWATYTAYNFGFAFLHTFLASRGIRIEMKMKSKGQKNVKLHVVRVLMPPMFYWLVSVFAVHLLNIFGLLDLTRLLDLWQFNVFIVLICIVIIIISVFRDGFMGLKFVTQQSDWDTHMSSINLNAANAIHVLNTHTVNMKSSIYLLGKYNESPRAGSSEKVSERLEILSNSITYLENYFDRIKFHTQSIVLKDESWWRVTEMLGEAETSVRSIYPGVSAAISVPEEDALFCDRVHVTEVFVNIIKNAAEAMRESGAIEITGEYNKAQLRYKYQLQFRDHGGGIDTDKVEDVFKPYSTSKNKEKNLGLGLSYCRSVIIAHGGRIYVTESVQGEGTTIGIDFPARRAKRLV